MKKVKMFIIIFFAIIFLSLLFYFFVGKAPQKEKINWGVVFSQKHARDLGLDWKENYLALLDDLNVREMRIITHWDLLEPQEGQYSFDDLDFQIREAEKRGAKILLTIGLKTGRWPECHIPDWAENLDLKRLKEKVLKLDREIVLRYKDSPAIWAWQVENEPFFAFGTCPKTDEKFIKEEIKIVKDLTGGKPVVLTDSGEGSLWIKISKLGDIGGTTMYRKVWVSWFKFYFNYDYLLPPVFYWRKAQMVERFFHKKMICTELQAEPWGPKLLYDSPLEEQKKTMDIDRFRKNIIFAKKTGFDTFYLWGGEWWYWLKRVHHNETIWNEAKQLFNP